MPDASSTPRAEAAHRPDAGPLDARSAALASLLEAKLLVPRRHSGSVRRTRLLNLLRSARDRSVVSIVAPPGYGKTSLVVQLAARDPRSVAWLTADDGDNDPVAFLSYLAAAIDRVEPLEPDVFGAITAPGVSSRAVVGRLVTTTARRARPTLVVIDDAHRIVEPACLDALAEFIKYLPEGSQVAVLGREPIGLPVDRWRADRSILEIGPGDLAMDEREAAALGRELGRSLSGEATTRLVRRTEGWPALLALALIGTRRRVGPDAGLDAAGDRLIADYLRSELLESRPEPEIAFLTRTSILERLSGPLCDVVADRHGSAELLADLARSTLLVDEYGGSYRYHALLRDFLRGELAAREPGQVAVLHRRAAAWYEANGSVELAVEHAFAAGDPGLAAIVTGRAMLGRHWSGRRTTARAWLRRFDDGVLEEHPWLAVLAAWEELGAGNVAAAERLANIAERGTFDGVPPDGTASFESGRAMLRAAMVRKGVDDALANAARAVALEPPGGRWRDYALWMLATARQATGDEAGADAAVADAIAAASSAGNDGLGHCLLGHRALLAVERGDWEAAVAFMHEGDALLAHETVDGYFSTAPGRAARIRIAIREGEIASARLELARAMSLRPLMTAAAPALSVLSLLGFARAHLAAGDPAGARTLLAQASSVIRLRPDLGVLPGEVTALRRTMGALPPALAGGVSSLTATELRVLALLPYYLSFKEIGQRLGIKATTVKTHALGIYGKLGASTRSEAVELASDAGLLERFPTGRPPSAIGEDAARRER